MTKQNDHPLDQALQHVDEHRRGFLGKLLAGGAAVVAIPTLSSIALGQAPGGRGGKGKGGPVLPSPADQARKWLAEFDRDNDGALNEAELTVALGVLQKELLQGRGKGGGKAGGGKAGGGAAGGGKGGGKAGGKGGGKGGGAGKGGGQGIG